MENIKIRTKQGKSPGKKIVILAGVHGNEVCGIKAFNKLIPNLNIEKGKVTFIYANLSAQKQSKRFVEYNLNRCFLNEQPENIKNTLEGKTAKAIMPHLNDADILLDLHSSNSSGNQSFIICEEDCLDIISCISPIKTIIGIDSTMKGGTGGYMFNQGKIGICVECGLHKSQESVEIAKESIINFLKRLGAINGDSKNFNEKELYKVDYMYRCKNNNFKLIENFKDFKKINEKTLIGHDGADKVYIKKKDIVMFPHEAEKIGEECFIILKEIREDKR